MDILGCFFSFFDQSRFGRIRRKIGIFIFKYVLDDGFLKHALTNNTLEKDVFFSILKIKVLKIILQFILVFGEFGIRRKINPKPPHFIWRASSSRCQAVDTFSY